MSFWGKVHKWQDKCRPFCTAIIPAAGTSQRMGGENKLFMNLAGAPVLMRTLCAIDRAELVDEMVIAAQEELLLEVADLCSRCGLHKPVRVIRGGRTRTESVLAAALEANPKAELLAVHDGARPLVRPEDFDEMIRLGCKTYAVAPALPVSDTIKVADMSGLVRSTPERKSLYAVQTPQVFQANLLRAALQSALTCGAELTDDCAAVERLGKEVYLAPGNPENIKITTPLDMTVAEGILKHREAQG
ncbi:MAG: 2-C-methyl-D-erythritol 4-phosphate cytidylyltransferase [Clostridiales bacterium]|nr:2-C-methyl-D-erythritol 4-phosphate cytidylyltransferase [Clostridiales bacterium]